MPWVIVRNTGIVPNGLVNVKNDVRHNKRKGSIVSIIINDNLVDKETS